MAFPKTLDELKERGYKFTGESQCKGCGDDLEWWETPNQKKIPMNHGTAVAHWSTCTNANDFRGKSDAPTSKVTSATLNMDWLKQQAAGCHCVVCKKLTGR